MEYQLVEKSHCYPSIISVPTVSKNPWDGVFPWVMEVRIKLHSVNPIKFCNCCQLASFYSRDLHQGIITRLWQESIFVYQVNAPFKRQAPDWCREHLLVFPQRSRLALHPHFSKKSNLWNRHILRYPWCSENENSLQRAIFLFFFFFFTYRTT